MARTIRKAYGPKSPVKQSFSEPTLSKQSFKKECDINNIMARYQKTGVVDHIAKHSARYGETTAQTFTEAEYIVANAKSMFEELPSKARGYFKNDPAAFLAFTEDYDPDTDKQQLIDLGLAAPGIALPSPAGDEASPEVPPEAPPEPPEQP